MNTLGYISLELVDHVAQAPYQGPTAPCPWDAVDPLTRHGLRTRARALLTDAIPALIAAGWTPPPPALALDACSCPTENLHDATGDAISTTRTAVDPNCPIHPYCYRCDYAKHICPGCGTDVPHGTTACRPCSDSDDTAWARAPLAACTCQTEPGYRALLGGPPERVRSDITITDPDCPRHHQGPSGAPGKPQ